MWWKKKSDNTLIKTLKYIILFIFNSTYNWKCPKTTCIKLIQSKYKIITNRIKLTMVLLHNKCSSLFSHSFSMAQGIFLIALSFAHSISVKPLLIIRVDLMSSTTGCKASFRVSIVSGDSDTGVNSSCLLGCPSTPTNRNWLDTHCSKSLSH